jgi:hypothetical protein
MNLATNIPRPGSRPNWKLVGSLALAFMSAATGLGQEPVAKQATSPAIVGEDIPPGWIPPGWIIIDGDIQVPAEFLNAPDGTYTWDLWSNSTVPNEFGPGIVTTNQEVALQAMADWEAVSAIDFVPRTNEPNWVRFQLGTGTNNSAVGMVGGMQVINITNWNLFTLRHELGHCLGLWHEQSRLDRDQYVTINYANICQDCCDGKPCDANFDKRPAGGGEYGPYDFESVMHYLQFQFSICSGTPGCETIIVKPPNQAYQNLIGTYPDLSFWDARVMSFLYAESTWRFLDIEANPPNVGSFFFPYNIFWQAVPGTPTGGVLWIQPGSYVAVGTLSKPMTLRAPLGGVTLGLGN